MDHIILIAHMVDIPKKKLIVIKQKHHQALIKQPFLWRYEEMMGY